MFALDRSPSVKHECYRVFFFFFFQQESFSRDKSKEYTGEPGGKSPGSTVNLFKREMARKINEHRILLDRDGLGVSIGAAEEVK